MKKVLTVWFSFLVAILFLNVQVLACSCMATPSVLDQFDGSEMVVTTRLVSVDKIREKEREYDIDHIRSVMMIVGKVYKGSVKPGQVLKFAQGGGADCIWTFDEEDVGTEYLFYLGKPSKGHPFFHNEDNAVEEMFYAGTCGRSSGLRGAIDDLAYLDNIEKVRGKTRLSGQFDSWYTVEPIGAGLKVQIIGKKKTYMAKTDKNGFFEIYDLPPGDYDVVPELPFGWKINDYMLERTSTGFEAHDPKGQPKAKNRIPVRITAKRHTALDLLFDIDTAIKGSVLSPAGKPMKGVCVKAVSTELKEGDYRGPSDCTDEKGEFLIDEMASGNYFLVVNDDGRMDGDEPFGVLFYPGVSEFKNAGIVPVEPGKYVTGLEIQIPQTVELIELREKLLFSDGKPVASEWIKFSPADEKRFDSVNIESDDAGNFVFKLPKGATGKVLGEMYTYIGEFAKCPKLDSLIKATGRTNHTFTTDVVAFDGSTPNDQIELTLPFPSCAKSKE